ncbi:rRNA maturation RNase YbeY, partial [Pseudomonas aeruginosa]|nr:rRNA maturation RNase YbeY [Pseudomonas aeruginosa]
MPNIPNEVGSPSLTINLMYIEMID